MKNISFDNPYLLLVAIPLLLLTVVPFIIAIWKGHKTKGVIASFIIHIFVIIVASFAVAGTYHTTVITETEVVVVADVSYSSNRNLDKIDEYIRTLEDKVPENSKIGVVCFAKEPILLTEFGADFTTVSDVLKDGSVDDSATDISAALDYASSMFSKNTIKRVVLITDGKQTTVDADSALARSIGNLYADDVYIDTVYIDNNLDPDTKEIQISDITFTKSSYINHEEYADTVVRSSYDTELTVTLLQNGAPINTWREEVKEGFNILNIELPTDVPGQYDYEVKIEARSDYSPHNNSYFFTQSIAETLNVLLITTSQDDVAAAERLYGETATIDSYVNKKDVPYSVDDMMKYDEIILSNVDVRELNNFLAFIDTVDTVVSDFGKSLVTIGDTKIQNKTDDILKQLEDMLPVKFGNDERDPKLFTFVIDISYSIFSADRFTMAKESVIQIMDLLSDDDWISFVVFAGSAEFPQQPTRLGDRREEFATMIRRLEPKQGTLLGNGLRATSNMLKSQASAYSERQLFLITDGLAYQGYTSDSEDPENIIKEMSAENIYISVINTACAEGASYLKKLAKAADGVGEKNYYYVADVDRVSDLVLGEIADDVTETVIEGDTPVEVEISTDEVLDGITQLPNINGYIYSKPKASADTVLNVSYTKASGAKLTSPLYATWSYGNGRVSSFTGSLSGEWVSNWQDGAGKRFLQNILIANTPEEKIDYPYTLNIDYYGQYTDISLYPAVLNADSSAQITIILPNGEVITESLPFNTNKFYYNFDTPDLGKYQIDVVYSYGNKSYESSSVFHLSYAPEYDSFATFMPDKLAYTLGNRGTLSIEEVPELVNDDKDVATYVVYFTVPLMIAAVTLYILDIILRKLRWNDIKSLFKKQKSKKAKEEANK